MIEGASALQRKLASIPTKLTDAVRVEMERQAEEIVGQMRRLVPVRKGDGMGGTLRASIGWTWGDAPAGSLIIGTVKTKNGPVDYGTMRITIYAGGKGPWGDAFYGRYQEFGTKKMAANPFFFPAYRARQRSAKMALTRAMRKALKDA